MLEREPNRVGGRGCALVLAGALSALSAVGCSTSPQPAKVATSDAAATCGGAYWPKTSDQLAALAARCETLTGDLHIESTSLVSLEPLSHLQAARFVVVTNNPGLTNLAGLRGLRSAVGITISGNRWLGSVRGLEGLTRLDGLVVTDNAVLANLDGLSGLTRVGDLVVKRNSRLSSLDGLGALQAARTAEIDGNPALEISDVPGIGLRQVAAGRLGATALETSATR